MGALCHLSRSDTIPAKSHREGLPLLCIPGILRSPGASVSSDMFNHLSSFHTHNCLRIRQHHCHLVVEETRSESSRDLLGAHREQSAMLRLRAGPAFVSLCTTHTRWDFLESWGNSVCRKGEHCVSVVLPCPVPIAVTSTTAVPANRILRMNPWVPWAGWPQCCFSLPYPSYL